MILEYSYDKGNLILEYFKKSELASLNIKTIKPTKKGDETKFVMEYTFIKDYPEPKQNLIRKVLAESLPERLQLTNVLNQFLENQILDAVNDFSLRFNAVNVRKCEISYSSSYNAVKSAAPKNLLNDLTKCLERFDYIVTEMGIADQATTNIFKKEGSGRNKKYVPLTIKDVGNTLRQSLMEE